jgi:hypothetical protein
MEFISLTDWFATFKEVPPHPSGESPLERLPTEILTQILLHLSPHKKDESGFLRNNLPGIFKSSTSILQEFQTDI